MRSLIYASILWMIGGTFSAAEEVPVPEEATFRVLGLFMEVRVDAFKQAAAQFEHLEVVRVNYSTGEATLRLRGPLLLRDGDPARQLHALNERVRIGTRGAFELLAPQTQPLSARTKVEIPISGHDCLGCSFGAYRAVYKLEGVHRVTADFGAGLLVAWIDPQVTNRELLREELVKHKVTLADPAGK